MGFRHVARGLRANPGFTAVVGLTVALGIGATTAIFSLVDAVLLRPVPYPKPQELVSVKIDLNGLSLTNVGMGVPELDDLRDHSGVFADISAVRSISANLTGSERPERIEALGVSPNYFALLVANAQLGRVFGEQDRVPGFAEAVILSDGIWRRLFGLLYRARQVVIADRPEYAAEVGEAVFMPFQKRLLGCVGVGPVKGVSRPHAAHREELQHAPFAA